MTSGGAGASSALVLCPVRRPPEIRHLSPHRPSRARHPHPEPRLRVQDFPEPLPGTGAAAVRGDGQEELGHRTTRKITEAECGTAQ